MNNKELMYETGYTFDQESLPTPSQNVYWNWNYLLRHPITERLFSLMRRFINSSFYQVILVILHSNIFY